MLNIILHEIAQVHLPSNQRVADHDIQINGTIKENQIQLIIDLKSFPHAFMDFFDAEIKRICQNNNLTPEIVYTKNRPAPETKAPVFTNKAIHNVRYVIAVGSGKGGVGKSTTALQIALALKELDMRVGVLDLDIYGPSLPRLTGITDRPSSNADKKIIPHEKIGLQLMSLGFMIDQEQAVIWRGPVVQTAVKQLLHDVAWGTSDAPLDFLILDLPPGTGDVQLTLVQKAFIDGAVIVSTPQDLALIDARKAVAMFEKVDVPILGMIENMSVLTCPNCQHDFHPFGHNGARKEAERLKIPFLGDVPLDLDLRIASDDGSPLYYQVKEGENGSRIGKIYRNIVLIMLKNLSATPSA